MAIDPTKLLEFMLQEIKKIASEALLTEVKPELETLAQRIGEIEKATLNKDISTEESKILQNMQKQAWKTELLSIEGRSEIAVQLLIRQALDSIRTLVNTELGWSLL